MAHLASLPFLRENNSVLTGHSSVEIFSALEKVGFAGIKIDRDGQIVAMSAQAEAIFQDRHSCGSQLSAALNREDTRENLRNVANENPCFDLVFNRGGRRIRARASRINVGDHLYIGIETNTMRFADA